MDGKLPRDNNEEMRALAHFLRRGWSALRINLGSVRWREGCAVLYASLICQTSLTSRARSFEALARAATAISTAFLTVSLLGLIEQITS